jgi:hypothetical protein
LTAWRAVVEGLAAFSWKPSRRTLVLATLFGCCTILALLASALVLQRELEREGREAEDHVLLDSWSGIPVGFEYLSAFPGRTARPLPFHRWGIALWHVRIALTCYDRPWVRSVVERVDVVDDLDVDGVSWGGTTEQPGTVIVRASMRGRGIHHEIGHLVVDRLDERQLESCWTCFARVPYRHPGNDAAGLSDPSMAGNGWQSDGLLSSYALTTWEEDFCEYFDHYVREPELLHLLADEHPAIAEKTAFLREVLEHPEEFRRDGAPALAALRVRSRAERAVPAPSPWRAPRRKAP